MAIKYLSGKRLQGTAAERTALNISSPTQTSWKEIGRVTLSSNGHTISVTGLTAKDNIMFLSHQITTGSGRIDGHGTLNGDTGNNYAKRENDNGGSDNVAGSQATFSTGKGNGTAADNFVVGNILNVASQEKLIITHATGGCAAGAGNVPSRREAVNKWANTSDAVSSIQLISGYAGSSDFAAGSELVVLGCDNDEADSGTNFWEELVYKDLDSSNLSSGTFAAKKYLMVRLGVYTGGTTDHRLRFNSDGGSNYANRRTDDGGSDSTDSSQSSIPYDRSNKDNISTIFIVNKSDKEKFCISETVSEGGSGAGTAPTRREQSFKWANTSAQITEINLIKNSGSNLASPSFIQVFGAD